MEKKCFLVVYCRWRWLRQMLFFINQTVFLFVVFMLFSVAVFAKVQDSFVNIRMKNASLVEVMNEITRETGYDFLYNSDIAVLNDRVDVNYQNIQLQTILNSLFPRHGLECELKDRVIVVRLREPRALAPVNEQKISGNVRDKKGEVLPGVTVLLKGTTVGTVTDAEGNFQLTIANVEKPVLIFSFIGMKTKEVSAQGTQALKVVLEDDSREIEEVVVTGYFNKTRESFTGSQVTVKAEEMKKVGALNIIQALNAFDPSIRLEESLEYGSDPNRVPEITIRGENGFDLRSSADNDRTNPNAPLYVLDGIEVSAQRIYDLDMNRVEQLSILKDATATALYGSRGANGVIVVTLKRPLPGEIRVSASANYNVSIPDLRDYNLMNASEKLAFEPLTGIWSNSDLGQQMILDIRYNELLKEAARGVNTYWLSKPLQKSVNQRYSMNFEGGDERVRYGIDLRYDTDKGIMKKSGREKYGVGVYFSYNIKDRLFIRNDVSVDNVTGDNTPYGSFALYAQQNPYDRIYDEDGNFITKLSTGNYNPLINPTLPNFSTDEYFSAQDNLSIDWRIIQSLRLQGRISYTRQMNKSEAFMSPASAEFRDEADPNKRGSYSIANSKSHSVDGNMTLAYYKNISNHLLNIGVGTNMQESENKGDSYTATGFVKDDLDFVGAGIQFKDKSKPAGSYDKRRLVGFFANVNYGYDNRYFLDFSYRTDGSSSFGRNSRFAPFWSFGLAWNVHKEHFWNNEANYLKIRASMGSTGSVNFSSSQALTTYVYDFNSEYNGVYGATFQAYGNPDLKWQNTKSYNVGVDWKLLSGRVELNCDAYMKITDNLLTSIDVAPSTGFSNYVENIGQVMNQGIEGRLMVKLIENRAKDLNWNVVVAAFSNRNKIQKLSAQMESLNLRLIREGNDITKVERRYQEGRSQSALMVVPSGGIDPASGNEVYIKTDGSRTFTYSFDDRVDVGDMMPKVEGNVNTNLNWKGFNLYLLFKYKWGGKAYNGTLASKVEGADPTRNVDRRAMESRWKDRGDEAKFRRITSRVSPYQTTRLVFDDNLFKLESISLSYDVPRKYLSYCHLERVKLMLSTTDIFRLSTIKQERGTIYPFARTFSVGLNITL